MRGCRLPEFDLARERKIAIAVIAAHGSSRCFHSLRWGREVGIHVFQSQDLRVVGGIGGVAHLIDTDAGYILQARNRHDSSCLSGNGFCGAKPVATTSTAWATIIAFIAITLNPCELEHSNSLLAALVVVRLSGDGVGAGKSVGVG